jgi:hypothetical protein
VSCTATGLTNGTAYTFTVTATNNASPAVASSPSAFSGSITPSPGPSAPTGLTAQAGNGAVRLSWSAPSSGGTITAYTVLTYIGAVQQANTCNAPIIAPLSCNVTGLANGTTYAFTVSATNASGTGPASSPASATPSPNLPGSPAGIAAYAGNGAATVTWGPTYGGLGSVTYYTVTSSPGSATCTTAVSLSCTVSGLTNGYTYTFTVTASNVYGTGLPSAPSSAVTPSNALPGAPYGVSAVAGYASAAVSWAAPYFTGYSAITQYTVTSYPGYNTCTWTSGPLACAVSSLVNGTSYTFTVTATNGSGTGAASTPSLSVTPSGTPATYHAIAPVRLLDSRTGNGMPSGVAADLSANVPLTFQIAGRSGVPSNATAVTGNLAVTDQTAGWAVYLGPDYNPSPTSSTINFTAGEVVANGVTVALNSTGGLSATYISASGNTTDLVFDVTGYFTADTSGETYHTINPVRVLDSRTGNGMPSSVAATLKANTPLTFTVAGDGAVPTNAVAVTGNLAVTDQTAGWAIFLGPNATASPTSSTINFVGGEIIANNVTVALGSSGTLSATFMSTSGNTTDIVFDVTGYFTSDSTGASYIAITPTRVLDSRTGNGMVGGTANDISANAPFTFSVAGLSLIPSNALAVTGNLTVTDQTTGWAVFLGPTATVIPTTSTINMTAGQVVANGVTVGLSSGGTLSATYLAMTGNTTDLVFDVTGYFVH